MTNNELLESLKTILSNFKSCIDGGNGELETDKEDIKIAESIIKTATLKQAKQMDKRFYMNYAEGQKTSTVKYENRDEAEKEAERLAEKLGVNVTTLKAVTEKQPKDIKLRVRTYADACAALHIEPLNERLAERLGLTEDEVAVRKLKTIVAALNEGWAPNWMNTSERKYYPYFYIDTDSDGLTYATTHGSATCTRANIGSRLCLKTSPLAEYAGTQFKELYEVILIGKTEKTPF